MPELNIHKPLQGVDATAAAHWNPNDRVIVIGAGVAGLSAAYTLKYLKVPFTVLEASSQPGGRVRRSEEFLADLNIDGVVELDVGAKWIHTEPTVLKDLILMEEDYTAVEKFLQEETIVFQPQTWGFYNQWTGSLNRMDQIKNEYKEYKFKHKSWSHYVERFILEHVKDQIVYNAVVQEIDYGTTSGAAGDDNSATAVTLTLENGTKYIAKKVICAVPVSILKAGDIRFVPELPTSKQRALEKTSMPPGFKVAIKFKEKLFLDASYDHSMVKSMFWNFWGGGADRLYFDALLGKGIDQKVVIGVYCYGDEYAKDMAQLDDGKLMQAILTKLDQMYDGKATANYVKHIVQNWTKEPYIRGAFSNPWKAERMEKEFGKAALGDNKEDNNSCKVFFAGEYVAGYLAPTVHGASLSGRRAAMDAIGKEYKF